MGILAKSSVLIKVVGFGTIGKNVTDRIHNASNLNSVEAVYLDSEKEVSSVLLDGTDMLIVVFDSAESNDGLETFISSAGKKEALVLGIAARSYNYMKKEEERIQRMIKSGVDSLHTVFRYVPDVDKFESLEKYSATEMAFKAIWVIEHIFNQPITINLNMDDARYIMEKKGIIQIGFGHGEGENKVRDAVHMAVDSPMNPLDMKRAKAYALFIHGDISLEDASTAADCLQSFAENDYIIFAAGYDESKEDACDIGIIATGIDTMEKV